MTTTNSSLIPFEPQSVTLPTSLLDAIAQWTEFARGSAAPGGIIPYNALGQDLAVEVKDALQKGNTFLADYQRAAEEWRKPDHDRWKAKIAASEKAVMELTKALGELHSQLLDFEREKRRVEESINRQRQEEAAAKLRAEQEAQRKAEEERQRQEREEQQRLAEIRRQAEAESNAKRRAELEAQEAAHRKAQAEWEAQRQRERQAEQQRLEAAANVVPFEAPKTEGLNTKVVWEYDIEDPVVFLAWCARERPSWINRTKLAEAFFRREIMEFLNSDGAERDMPGLRVYQALGAKVRAEKRPKTLTVQSRKVEM
jgi:DNA segregation ATPase FtsK/SpoIIIE-like protein